MPHTCTSRALPHALSHHSAADSYCAVLPFSFFSPRRYNVGDLNSTREGIGFLLFPLKTVVVVVVVFAFLLLLLLLLGCCFCCCFVFSFGVYVVVGVGELFYFFIVAIICYSTALRALDLSDSYTLRARVVLKFFLQRRTGRSVQRDHSYLLETPKQQRQNTRAQKHNSNKTRAPKHNNNNKTRAQKHNNNKTTKKLGSGLFR